MRAVFPRIFEAMQPNDICDMKVLVAPLNWGMGHVSRSIGLVDQLRKQNNSIIVACDPMQQRVFEMYFSELTFLHLEGYPFKFGGKGHFAWDLLRNWKALAKHVTKEAKQIEDWIRVHEVDIVLSDHRYGCYSKSVPSVFITHQYNLPVSGVRKLADRWHKKFMRSYSTIWLLDTPENTFAGKLSKVVNDPRVFYIGLYSRFSFYDVQVKKSIESVVIVSGPEIYAQQFADQMVKRYPSAVFICAASIDLPPTIQRVSGSWGTQDATILKAKKIISRSGYTTIMDTVELGVSATFYPTPGQAEQVYLNNRLTIDSQFTPQQC